MEFDTSLNQRFALSYTGNSLNLTANVIWGTHFDHVTGSPQLSPCPTPLALNGCNPDFLNVDLTASRKFGDWEFGLVAFGSMDLNSPIDAYAKQSQIAVGGLIGKSFGPAILQAYLTTDVYEKNYGGHDTRLWGRVIFPLWHRPGGTSTIDDVPKGVKPFLRIEPGRCMGAESGATASGQPSMRKITEVAVQAKGGKVMQHKTVRHRQPG